MTATKNHRAEIKIATRHGHVRPHVRWRFLDLEGSSAVVVIAIILAARCLDVIMGAICNLAGYAAPKTASLLARFARSSVHHIARISRQITDFYQDQF